MNALWLERMSRYRSSTHQILTALRIINVKIQRQNILLRRYRMPVYEYTTFQPNSINDILLHEARAAKHFWKQYNFLLPSWTAFPGRKPRSSDIANKLLDIGYHHITGIVKKTLLDHEVSPALGLLHIAGKRMSTPLAYDLVELFRADIVDAEVLRFLRLKKRPVTQLSQAHIGHFLHEVNERLVRKYYLHDFKQCHTYRYYLELQIVKFIKAVNRNEPLEPLYLPTRNESRCT